MARIKKAASALAFAGAMLLAAVACAEIGNEIIHRSSAHRPKSNHEYQRESALRFRVVWANVERIRYREEGSAGIAVWAASAVATVDGKDYEVVLGPSSLGFPHGDTPPDMRTLPPSASPVVLTIIYSDGTTEAIQ